MLGIAQPAFALQQPAAPPPAAAQAPQGSLSVIVAEVTGNATVSTDDGKTWQKAMPGQSVSEGAQFRTGMKSSITCVIPPDQTFKLESLSTIRVAEAAKRGNRTRTDLVMKYGAASYGIEKAGAEHESTIRTPSSTLAVRGTVVRVTDQAPFPPTAESFTGQAAYRALQRETRLGGRGYAAVSSVQGSAAETALANSVVDPATARARSASETRLISEQVSRGALVSFDNQAQIPVIRGGPGPQSNEALAASLPGRLTFVLRWTGNTDLNFLISNQPVDTSDIGKLSGVLGKFTPQELLYPGYGLNSSTTGGLIPFDHRGGANGGQEVAFWTTSFPSGVYGLAPLFVSGQPTEFRINAFLDGQAVPLFDLDAEGNLIRFNTYRGNFPSSVPGVSTIAIVPKNEFFDFIPSGDPDDPQVTALARKLLAQYDASRTTMSQPSLATAGSQVGANKVLADAPFVKPVVTKSKPAKAEKPAGKPAGKPAAISVRGK
jgi:hypothetical protein